MRPLPPWLKRLLCAVFGHAWVVVRELEIGGSLIECVGCQNQVCYHPGRRQVIPYDSEVEQFEIAVRRLKASVAALDAKHEALKKETPKPA